MSLRWFAAAFALCCAATGWAQNEPKPLLWRIEGSTPSYLFGTIHLGDARVVAVLDRVGPLIDGCAAVYTEIPMDKATQMRGAAGLLGQGGNLSEQLPKDLYERASAELKRIHPMLSLAPFETMEIWALAVSLPLLEEQFRNPGQQALDALIYARAENQAGKTVGGLETLEDQLGVFRGFDTGDQIAMLRATLDDLETARREKKNALQELRTAYLSGSLERIERKMNEWTGSLPPALRERLLERLLTQRNARMAASIVRLLKASPQSAQFFAVGAAHLAGPTGLLAELQKAGLVVKRVDR